MAATVDDLFLFGDDFEAILALLENDEAIEGQFSATVGDVSTMSVKFDLCLAWSDRKEPRDYSRYKITTNTTSR